MSLIVSRGSGISASRTEASNNILCSKRPGRTWIESFEIAAYGRALRILPPLNQRPLFDDLDRRTLPIFERISRILNFMS